MTELALVGISTIFGLMITEFVVSDFSAMAEITKVFVGVRAKPNPTASDKTRQDKHRARQYNPAT